MVQACEGKGARENFNVIRNMYNNIKACVMLKQETSDTFVCNVRVRQGENLSPLLFAFLCE